VCVCVCVTDLSPVLRDCVTGGGDLGVVLLFGPTSPTGSVVFCLQHREYTVSTTRYEMNERADP